MAKQYFTLSLIIGLLGLFLYSSLYTELVLIGRVVLWSIGIAAAVASLAFVLVFALKGYDSVMTGRELKRSQIMLAHLEARDKAIEIKVKEIQGSVVFNSAQPGHQVYAAHLSGGQVVIDPLHLTHGRVNGVDPDYDSARWTMNLLAHGPRPIEPAQLGPIVHPALTPGLPERVDLAPYIAGGSSLRSIFLGVGRLPDGRVTEVRAPLGRLVHVAMGGASGFGKSTLAQALALQVIEARELPRPVMLDAQGVTFSAFRGNPRLLYPLAEQEDEIEGILEALVREMAHRAGLFRDYRGVQSLDDYNALPGVDRLPVIPVFFDEFSIVGDNKHIARFSRELAQKARKTGIQLIAGCQTWLAQDIGSALRANMSTAIQFYVRDKNQSRLLLGSSDAASLTLPGQAFAVLPGQSGLIELQTPDPSGLLDPLVGEQVAPVSQVIPQPSRAVTVGGWDTETVVEVYRQTGSLAAVARAHGKSPGGKQNEEIREILKERGIEL